VRAGLARTLKAMRILARDRRIPRPLRWLAALALLPIPGPFDEAVLLALTPIFVIFHREKVREAWRQTAP
jgi:hypothetical protein